MRKILLLLFCLIYLSSIGQTLIDAFTEGNTNSNTTMYTGSYVRVGQSFTNPNIILLASCKFYLKKTGSPTGNGYAKIYAHTGTYGTSSLPTGTALATSDAFDISSLTVNYQLITFTFTGTNNITLSANTYYVLTFEGGGANSSNTIVFATSSLGYGGNFCRYSTSWGVRSTTDAIYYVYGNTPTASSPSFIWSPF